MTEPIRLRRPRPVRTAISLAPMIDVLMIMLVFFMVTSTYLDLDMIRAVAPTTEETPATAPGPETETDAQAPTLLVRIDASGGAAVRGQPLSPPQLASLLRDTVTERPATQVLILPSGAAPMQALVTVMETATQAGATRLRVVRLEARP